MRPQHELYPIVISPQRVTLGNWLFTYAGRGLLMEGHAYEPELNNHLLPLEDSNDEDDAVLLTPPPEGTLRPLSYWRAQCVFRGLQPSGTAEQLQSRLRMANTGMLVEYRLVEQQIDKSFREKNAHARSVDWEAIESVEEKVEVNPLRYLRETFPRRAKGDKSGKSVVVLKVNQHLEVSYATLYLKLPHELVQAPLNADGKENTVAKWIVVGRSSAAVNEKVREINLDAALIRRQVEASQRALVETKHKALIQKWHLMQGHWGHRSNSTSGKWDVAGSWAISCPFFEKMWGPGGSSQCKLSIGFTQRARRRLMWAEFDFNVLTGIFRFVNPTPDNSGRLFPALRPPDVYLRNPSFYLTLDDIEEQERAMTPSQHGFSARRPFHRFTADGEGTSEALTDLDQEGQDAKEALEVENINSSGIQRQASEIFESMLDNDDDDSMKDTEDETFDKNSSDSSDSSASCPMVGGLEFDKAGENWCGEHPEEMTINDSNIAARKEQLLRSNAQVGRGPGSSGDVAFDVPEEPNEFYFSAYAQPASYERTWFYRWRGEDAVTGQKQSGSDRNVCSVEFSGPGGMHLRGTFFSKLVGRVSFEGWKTGPLDSRMEVEREWVCRGR
ncbi:MAG: hypothetical protein M4579_003823 [Chaenotheca gracillima]|nr:MAG: hypothetical protein M4579_003823 [Chaenotheca gracillima]